jgi:3-oxoacyl-[acyl-carrier protein] reductase
MDLGLKGKIAMVGGASKGLGFAVARALAGEGAQVCIASRDAAAIQRAADTIRADTGGSPLAVAADLSRADGVAAWHEADRSSALTPVPNRRTAAGTCSA